MFPLSSLYGGVDAVQHEENARLHRMFGQQKQPAPAAPAAAPPAPAPETPQGIMQPKYLMPLTMAYTAVMPSSAQPAQSFTQRLMANMAYLAVAYFVYSTLDWKLNLEMSSAPASAFDSAGVFIFCVFLVVWYRS